MAYIRKQLPSCSAEEAHNALEACEMDVSASIASLLQVCHPASSFCGVGHQWVADGVVHTQGCACHELSA